MPWKVCETSALNRDETAIKRGSAASKIERASIGANYRNDCESKVASSKNIDDLKIFELFEFLDHGTNNKFRRVIGKSSLKVSSRSKYHYF